jgi:hypothetical protein
MLQFLLSNILFNIYCYIMLKCPPFFYSKVGLYFDSCWMWNVVHINVKIASLQCEKKINVHILNLSKNLLQS